MAYRSAVENGWLDDYYWFSKPNSKWNYQTCMEESKKYSTRSEFAAGSSGAYHVASKNKWLDKYTWLPVDGRELKYEKSKWNFENCYKEALKYTRMTDFERLSNSAYNSTVRNGWIEKFTWLKLTRKPRNYWDYEHCYQEAQKYTTILEFQKKSSGAYHAAVKGGFLKEFTWLKLSRKPRGYWNYDHCYDEARKYKSISEYQRGSSASYRAAHKNGWIKDYKWFKKDYGQLELFE